MAGASLASNSKMTSFRDDDLFIEPASDEDVVYGDYNATMEGGSGGGGQRPYIRLTTQLKNATREAGQEMRMRCEAVGTPPIAFTWMKNHAPVEKSRRVKMRNRDSSSRLVITGLDVLDSGFYQCIASNSAASVNSTAILRVKNASVEKNVKNRPSGSRHPPALSEEYDDYEGTEGMENPLGRLPSEEEGDLYSVPDSAAGPGYLPVGPSERWLDEKRVRAGECVPYRGEACRQFLAGRHIKITSDNREDMYDIDRNLRAAMLFINNSPSVSQDCKRISHAVACFHMYKVCDMKAGNEGRLQAICRNDCEKLTSEVCPSELSLAAEHDLVGDGPRALFPSCATLPPSTEACLAVLRSPSSPSPSEEEMNWLPRHDHWCYVDSGRQYAGLVAETASGKQCLDWERSPSREFSHARYEELRHSKNYCRNPGGRRTRPWCYASPHGQEEYCNVPLCPPGVPHHKDTNNKANGSEGGMSGWGALWLGLSPSWQLGIVAGTAMAALLLLLLCCLCCCRRKPRSGPKGGRAQQAQPLPPASLPQSVINSASNSTYYRKLNGTSTPLGGGRGGGVEMASLLSNRLPPPYEHEPPPLHVMEIAGGQLQLQAVLGNGMVGVLQAAVWTAAPGGPLPVAVKALRHDASNAERATLEEEVRRLASLDHEHVQRLVGVSYLEGSRFSAVLEYSFNGDLHELLSLRSIPSLGEEPALDAARLAGDAADFTAIATQISSGMEFLSSLGLVHRDLATRNVLVGEQLRVKIADLASMRACYDSDYYKLPHRAGMPIRWMSREAVEQCRFSEKSDVWAFGVTLWEIFSYGRRPFEGYSDKQVLELVGARQLLECPSHCPTGLYSVMVECWHENADRRPSFSELFSRLQTWTATSPAHSLLHGVPRASSSSHSGSSTGRLPPSRARPHAYPPPSRVTGGPPRPRPDDSSPLMRDRGLTYQYSDEEGDSD